MPDPPAIGLNLEPAAMRTGIWSIAMPTANRGPVDVGSAPFMPHVSKTEGRCATVSLLRRLPNGTHAAVWSHACAPKDAKAICAWMWERPESWSFWAELARCEGADALDGRIVAAARREAEDRAASERYIRLAERRAARLADGIRLYLFSPVGRRPSLGLQRVGDRGCFWRMSFVERWERDRVADWLRWQRDRFDDFDAFFAEHGGLALERLVLAGMREAEREAEEDGTACDGPRPLRLWRGPG